MGDGPERQRLEDRASKLGCPVTFWGYQAHPAAFFKDVSLFVLPSFSEGLPVSVAEAMLTGTPCAATRVGGAPEFVEEGVNGWLIDPYDGDAFVGLLRRITEMPAEERRKIGEKGRETARDKFMPERYQIGRAHV